MKPKPIFDEGESMMRMVRTQHARPSLRPSRPSFGLLLAGLALSMLLGLASASARADIYGYFDADGNAHFATEALDPHYRLLMRGDQAFDSSAIGRGLPLAANGHSGNSLLRYLSNHPGLKKYETLINRAAAEFRLEPALLNAIMAAESGFNPNAVSSKGAVGLMQILPATAERYGLQADKKRSIAKKLTDPAINIRLAARYLSDLKNLFPQRPELVVASYNAGEGAVQKYRNQIPPFPETRNYVQLVSQFYQLYNPGRQQEAAEGNANINTNTNANTNTNVKATRVTMVIPAPHRTALMRDTPAAVD